MKDQMKIKVTTKRGSLTLDIREDATSAEVVDMLASAMQGFTYSRTTIIDALRRVAEEME